MEVGITTAVLAEQPRAEGDNSEEALRLSSAGTARAQALLLRHLTAAQQDLYTAEGCFWVRGSRGGKYLLTSSPFYSVLRFRGRKWTARYCATLRQSLRDLPLPQADILLAQKLLLETNEPLFRWTANTYGGVALRQLLHHHTNDQLVLHFRVNFGLSETFAQQLVAGHYGNKAAQL